MTVTKMSVHRGLAELKLLDSKIASALQRRFIVGNKQSNKTIDGRTLDEVRNAIKGNFDSITALIENRKRIKDQLVKSNAVTVVTVANKSYTVAEAIERKNSVKYDENLLSMLKTQFSLEKNKVEKENSLLPSKLETYLASVLGEKGSRTAEDVKLHTKVFEDSNKWELIDPNNISTYIDTLENDIQEFETNVDYVLSESNATTFIDVDFVS
jgi:hypothetical protein